MGRTTVDLQDLDEWVDQAADSQGRSKAAIVRSCVRAVREGAVVDPPDSWLRSLPEIDAPRTDDHRWGPDRPHRGDDRITELEARVDALAERVADLEPVSEDDVKAAVHDMEWKTQDATDDPELRTMLVDAACIVRDQGRVRTGELLDQVTIPNEFKESTARGVLTDQLPLLPWIPERGQGSHYYDWSE